MDILRPARFAPLLLLLLLGACAPSSPYVSIEISKVETVGDVEIEVHHLGNFLFEVDIRNRSPQPVVIDWSESLYLNTYGREEPLLLVAKDEFGSRTLRAFPGGRTTLERGGSAVKVVIPRSLAGILNLPEYELVVDRLNPAKLFIRVEKGNLKYTWKADLNIDLRTS